MADTVAPAGSKKRKGDAVELDGTADGDGGKGGAGAPQRRLSIAERKRIKKAHNKASAPGTGRVKGGRQT